MMYPKHPREENAHYRDMAEGRSCTMRLDVCNYDDQTTVLAHSNRLSDGKGRGMKAHDYIGVWACSSCHAWLDQGSASREEKSDAFDVALGRMAAELERIVGSATAKPRDIKAAKWALDRLNAKLCHA